MKQKFYAVSKYVDSINLKAKPSFASWEYRHPRADYFDSEAEARAFIQDRAFKKVEAAKVAIEKAYRALKNAEKHLEKMRAKFPVSLA